eukprot:403365394
MGNQLYCCGEDKKGGYKNPNTKNQNDHSDDDDEKNLHQYKNEGGVGSLTDIINARDPNNQLPDGQFHSRANGAGVLSPMRDSLRHQSASESKQLEESKFNDEQSQSNTIIQIDGQLGQESTMISEYANEDHLSDYEFDGDSDVEIEDLAQYRNDFEKSITFTKRGLVQEIEQLFAFENSDTETKLWDLKLNKDDVKVYLKKGGSKYNADQPYIKTEILFKEHYSIKKIVEVIFGTAHRQKWDKNVLKYELMETAKCKNTALNYQLNKSPLNFSNRDFMDKQIKFSDKDTVYCYYSSLPSDEQQTIKPIPPKVERAQTILGYQKLHRRTEDGKIVYQMIMQCDLKMKITPKLIGMFLPNGLQDWARKCNKYLNDNYDKI